MIAVDLQVLLFFILFSGGVVINQDTYKTTDN